MEKDHSYPIRFIDKINGAIVDDTEALLLATELV